MHVFTSDDWNADWDVMDDYVYISDPPDYSEVEWNRMAETDWRETHDWTMDYDYPEDYDA